jgi:hypothetical protein
MTIEPLQIIHNIQPLPIDDSAKLKCFKFYEMLKNFYPQAIAHHDSDHVITEIDGKFYDSTGEVEQGRMLPIVGNEWKIYNKD